jgi:hypothetical protein
MRYLCFLTHYFSVRSLCFPSPLSDYCGPWLQRYSTFSTFSWSLHAYRHIECCSILCILSTVCYSILCDNNTRAFSPALLTKISEKNWFLQILFLYLGMSMLSVFVIYLGYMCLFLLILLLIRLLTCTSLHFTYQRQSLRYFQM